MAGRLGRPFCLENMQRATIQGSSGKIPALRALHIACLGAILAPFLFTGCRATAPPVQSLQRYEYNRPAMGTLFTITLFAPDEESARSAATAAFRRIDALEDVMSDYQADSELNRLRELPPGKPAPASADLFEVLRRAQKLAELSGGAFDPTVGPYVRLWRFSRKRKVLSSQAEMAVAAAAVGYRKLRLDSQSRTVTLLAPNMQLDLGGIAKGYAADEALRLLKGRGMPRALVAASGDIAIGDPPPGQRGWKIAISGMDADAVSATPTLLLKNCGVSTSGDTEQFIEIDNVRYSHIVDPRTGLGLTNRIQATIIAPHTTASDSLATTVCVLGPKRGLALVNSLPRVAALVLTEENGTTQRLATKRFEKLSRKMPGEAALAQ
jgi:FAD:protein FMN transferase